MTCPRLRNESAKRQKNARPPDEEKVDKQRKENRRSNIAAHMRGADACECIALREPAQSAVYIIAPLVRDSRLTHPWPGGSGGDRMSDEPDQSPLDGERLSCHWK